MSSTGRVPVAILLLVASAACGGSAAAPAGPSTCPEGSAVNGSATYYGPGTSNACSFPSTPSLGVALAPGRFAGSAACGACLRVTGPRGTITVRVADLCPSCTPDQLDLTPDAFAAIQDPVAGVASVTFRQVACTDPGPVQYELQGSNPFYVRLVVENPRFEIASLELRPTGVTSFSPAARDASNGFVLSFTSAAASPLDVRVTDVHGHVLTDTVPIADGIHAGAAQFSATCP